MTSKNNTEPRRPAWLAGVLAMLLCVPVWGHDPLAGQRLPAWTVLVLKLVSDTHVEPTTGIVVSPDGHVLVPAEFTAGGEPLVVLDGGADVVRNGRPAVVQERFRLEGLALLKVDHLARQPVAWASGLPAAGDPVLFLAFPPAEQITAGETRVARLATIPADGRLGEDLGLPNITGAIVNGCEQLVGFSAARGVQSLSSDASTLYHGLDSLAGLLARAGMPLGTSPCQHSLAPHASSAAADPAPSSPEMDEPTLADTQNAPVETPPQTTEPLPQESAPDSAVVPEVAEPESSAAEPTGADAETTDDGDLDPAPESVEQVVEETTQPPESTTDESTAQENSSEAVDAASPAPADAVMTGLLPIWAWWLVGALLLALGVSWALFRRAPQDKPQRIALWLRPETGDGAIGIPLRKGVVEVTLGRFETDIVLKGSSISRRHARLTGTPRALFVVDLGSSNGTSVNGAACDAGRSVPLVDGDVVKLGDQSFVVDLPTQQEPVE